jgi:hypothetical protein
MINLKTKEGQETCRRNITSMLEDIKVVSSSKVPEIVFLRHGDPTAPDFYAKRHKEDKWAMNY